MKRERTYSGLRDTPKGEIFAGGSSLDRKFLVLEDAHLLRSVIKQILVHSYSAEVGEASTNTEALAYLQSHHPHLIITDLIHPGGMGVEFLKVLQKDRRLRGIPIIVQSGSVRQWELECWRAGARAIIEKPYTTETLIDAVDRLLEIPRDIETALIRLGMETQSLDYKEALPLDSSAQRAAFAKDVIAFANFGGGHVVVGVAEKEPGLFELRGLDKPELATLETSRLNRAVRSFLDPPIALTSRRVVLGKQQFIVISIPSAEGTLVMAAKMNEQSGLFPGRIYGRTAAAESAEIRSAAEIRAMVLRLVRDQIQKAETS